MEKAPACLKLTLTQGLLWAKLVSGTNSAVKRWRKRGRVTSISDSLLKVRLHASHMVIKCFLVCWEICSTLMVPPDLFQQHFSISISCLSYTCPTGWGSQAVAEGWRGACPPLGFSPTPLHSSVPAACTGQQPQPAPHNTPVCSQAHVCSVFFPQCQLEGLISIPIIPGARPVCEEMWQPALCLSVMACPAGTAHVWQLCPSKTPAHFKTAMNFHEKPSEIYCIMTRFHG